MHTSVRNGLPLNLDLLVLIALERVPCVESHTMHVLHEEMQILFACALPIEMLYKHDCASPALGQGPCGLAATVLLCVLHFAKGSMLSCPVGAAGRSSGCIPDSVSSLHLCSKQARVFL